MNTLVIILILLYFAACIFAGIKASEELDSVVLGFFFFVASIALTPIVTIAILYMRGGAFFFR